MKLGIKRLLIKTLLKISEKACQVDANSYSETRRLKDLISLRRLRCGRLPFLNKSLIERLDPPPLKVQPTIDDITVDISVVTYRNERWIRGFVDSLLAQEFPLHNIRLLICDHSPESSVIATWHECTGMLRSQLRTFNIVNLPNKGFGSGHNVNINIAKGTFVLISNVDIEFRRDTIARLVATAASDTDRVAAWECRQEPYEHPKYYDPVTLETHWCSAAACLYKRELLMKVGGFDENIFMYGEDVDLSFALRRAGYGLRYVPSAVVRHYAYDSTTKISGKPHQSFGSVFSFVYIAKKYGVYWNIVEIFPTIVRRTFSDLLKKRSVFPGCAAWFKAVITPNQRKTTNESFRPFIHRLDYEMVRTPPWVPVSEIEEQSELPLVSIIMRTHGDRQAWVSQALHTVAHQTYSHLEVCLVEDGCQGADEIVSQFREAGLLIRHIRAPRGGRCRAGNIGLAAAGGSLLMFLDDDDGLFADHVETLVQVALKYPLVPVLYSGTWEIVTKVISLNPLIYVERMYLPGPGNSRQFSSSTMINTNLIPIQSAIFRRSAYETHGGLDESLEYLEDWNLWMRFMKSGDFVKSDRITSFYRTPDDLAIRDKRINDFTAAHHEAVVKARLLTAHPLCNEVGGSGKKNW